MKYETLKEALYWAYANTAMAHQALTHGSAKYNRTSYMVRSRLYKGLMSGTMNIKSLYDDERERLKAEKKCVYCGSASKLSLDHLIAKSCGGSDSADNLVYACRSCNSSKSDQDLLHWYVRRDEFPPLFVLRRYLKLLVVYCEENSLMDAEYDKWTEIRTPFRIDLIPLDFPSPDKIHL